MGEAGALIPLLLPKRYNPKGLYRFLTMELVYLAIRGGHGCKLLLRVAGEEREGATEVVDRQTGHDGIGLGVMKPGKGIHFLSIYVRFYGK